jgi:uncharacterized protein YaaR (DUF327 family)
MSYFTLKTAPATNHNYKATCQSVDRAKYGAIVQAKIEKLLSKIVSIKATGEDVAELEAAYTEVKAKANELRFSTNLRWLQLNKVIEQSFLEIVIKYNKLKKIPVE